MTGARVRHIGSLTPLIHRELDTTVPPSQSFEVYYGLAALGKSTTLVTYRDQAHDITSSPDYWPRVLGWFDTYLGVKL